MGKMEEELVDIVISTTGKIKQVRRLIKKKKEEDEDWKLTEEKRMEELKEEAAKYIQDIRKLERKNKKPTLEDMDSVIGVVGELSYLSEMV